MFAVIVLFQLVNLGLFLDERLLRKDFGRFQFHVQLVNGIPVCLVGFQVVAHTVNAAFQLQGEQFVGMLSDILGTGISLFGIMVGRIVFSLIIEQCAVHIIHF